MDVENKTPIKNKHNQLPLVYTYAIPKIHATDIIATNSDYEAIQYIEAGYTLFTVPQMFGCEKGIITLYRTTDSTPIKDGTAFLERYKRNSRTHISGGSKMNELEYEKKQHRYWHRMFCISMLLLGGTWGAIIFYLLFG